MYNYTNYLKTKTNPWDLRMCVGAQPQMAVQSRKPAQPVKFGSPLIPGEVHSYRLRPRRAGDFSLNHNGLEKRVTRGARDPASVGPAPARLVRGKRLHAPPGPAPPGPVLSGLRPQQRSLHLPGASSAATLRKGSGLMHGAAVKTRIAAGSCRWTHAGGGTSAPFGVRQAGGGSVAGAGRL